MAQYNIYSGFESRTIQVCIKKMGWIDIQPLYKTRLPSKYVDVVTIEKRIPQPPQPVPLLAGACNQQLTLHYHALCSCSCSFSLFADRLVEIVFSNQMPKSKLLKINRLRACQIGGRPWQGTIFQKLAGIMNPIQRSTYRYVYVIIDGRQVGAVISNL